LKTTAQIPSQEGEAAVNVGRGNKSKENSKKVKMVDETRQEEKQ
jgi:hypothetical protein